MSVRIQTTATHKFGQKNVIPYLGVTEISSDGIVIVESMDIALKIVECNIGFNLIDEAETTTTTTEAITTTTTIPEEITTTTTVEEIVDTTTMVEEEITTTTTEELSKKAEEDQLGKEAMEGNDIGGAQDSGEDLLTKFNALRVADLQELAKPFPKTEWQNHKKDDLIAYLIEKLTPAAE